MLESSPVPSACISTLADIYTNLRLLGEPQQFKHFFPSLTIPHAPMGKRHMQPPHVGWLGDWKADSGLGSVLATGVITDGAPQIQWAQSLSSP